MADGKSGMARGSDTYLKSILFEANPNALTEQIVVINYKDVRFATHLIVAFSNKE